MSKRYLIAAGLCAGLILPAGRARADHGQTSVITGPSRVVLNGVYAGGQNDEQDWTFIGVDATGPILACDGFGSVEVGFVSSDCHFTIGGTGVFVGYPGTVDQHDVTYTDSAGNTTTVTETVVG